MVSGLRERDLTWAPALRKATAECLLRAPDELQTSRLLSARSRREPLWMDEFYDGQLYRYLANQDELTQADLCAFFRLTRQEISEALEFGHEKGWYQSFCERFKLPEPPSPFKEDAMCVRQTLRAQLLLSQRPCLAWLFWSACDTLESPVIPRGGLANFVALALLAARVCRITNYKSQFWRSARLGISELLSNVQTASQAIPLTLLLIICVFPLKTESGLWNVGDGVNILAEVMKCTKSAKDSDPFVLRYCLAESLLYLLDERSGRSVIARSTLLRETALAYPGALANALNVPSVRVAWRESAACDWGLRLFRMHPSDGVGWRNLRNTCFLAASVNALFLTTPALTAFTKALEAATPESSWPILDACSGAISWSQDRKAASDQQIANNERLSFAWEFLRCLVEAHFSDKHILSLSRLRELCPIGQNATQEDVSELLHWLLNYFASLSRRGNDANAFSIPLSRATSLVYLNEAATSPTCSGGTVSPASDLFQIKQSMIIFCRNCQRRRLVSESSFAVLLSVDGSDDVQSPLHHIPSLPPPVVHSLSTSSSQVQSLTQSVLEQRDRARSVASSVLELQSQTSSVTTRESSLTQISTDFVGSDSLSQLEDFRHSFDDAEQILVVSDLYKGENPPDSLNPDIELTKPKKAPQQLTELINRYMRFETLADYRCDEVDGCGTLGESGKQTIFCRLPQILVIVLNRFRHVGESAKIRLPVVVTRFLAISKDADDGGGTEYEIFEIYCAVIHCGTTLDSGHYKVVGKPLSIGTQAAQPFNSNWFSFDDAQITPTTFTALQQCCYSEMDTPYILFFNKVKLESGGPQRDTTSSFAVNRIHSAPVTPSAHVKEVSLQLEQTDPTQELQGSFPARHQSMPKALGADTIEELRRLVTDTGRPDATGEDRGTMASSEDNDDTMDATVTDTSSRVQVASSSLRLHHMVMSERDDFRVSSPSEADFNQTSRLARHYVEGSLLMPFQLVAETVEGNIQNAICAEMI